MGLLPSVLQMSSLTCQALLVLCAKGPVLFSLGTCCLHLRKRHSYTGSGAGSQMDTGVWTVALLAFTPNPQVMIESGTDSALFFLKPPQSSSEPCGERLIALLQRILSITWKEPR